MTAGFKGTLRVELVPEMLDSVPPSWFVSHHIIPSLAPPDNYIRSTPAKQDYGRYEEL